MQSSYGAFVNTLTYTETDKIATVPKCIVVWTLPHNSLQGYFYQSWFRSRSLCEHCLICAGENIINTFCTCISVRKDSIVILCWFSSSRYMSLSWRHSSSSADEIFVSDAFSPIVPSFRPAISLSLDCKRKDFPFLSSCFAIMQYVYLQSVSNIYPTRISHQNSKV